MSEHPRDVVYLELEAERLAQDARWGEQNHPDGTGGEERRRDAEWARANCQRAAIEGTVTWADILEEEALEALAESDPARLREELVQVAAVAVAWVECLDRMRRG
jgi:hypothetical protein